MATVSTDLNNFNVTVQSIPDKTSTSGGSSFNVNSTSAATGTALSSPGQSLVVQIGIENDRGDPDTCTLAITDSYGNSSFQGIATISWEQDDTSLVWIQFSDFPLQADQVTLMDKCNYSISVSNQDGTGTEVFAQVYTL